MVYAACGVYQMLEGGDPCHGIVVYKQVDSARLMYFVDNYWIVHDEVMRQCLLMRQRSFSVGHPIIGVI